jgi:hypothetical protein
LPPLPAPGAGVAPIQRVLDASKVLTDKSTRTWGKKSDSMRRQLLASVAAHNQALASSDGGQAAIHAQMKHLDDIEHTAYRWFNHSQQDETDANRAGMFELLNQVQAHHQEMVRQTVAGGHQLWVHDQVSAGQRTNVDRLWSEITDNTRNTRFRYDTHTQTGGLGAVPMPADYAARLQEESNAQMARLLSRPQGRKLVSHLHARAGALGQPVLLTTSNPVGMLGDPHDPQNPVTPSLSPSAQTPNVPAQELHKITGRRPKQKSTVPGAGVQFGLRMMPGIKDADFSDYDESGRRIPSPTFVGLGHELTHGAHYMSGSFLPNADLEGLPAHYKGDVEEFLTIAPRSEHQKLAGAMVARQGMSTTTGGTQDARFRFSEMMAHNQHIPNEADIRAEHGLPIRHGHTSSLTPEMHPGAVGGDDELRQSGWQHITAPRSIARKLYADVNDETPEQLRARQAAAAAPQARRWWDPRGWW